MPVSINRPVAFPILRVLLIVIIGAVLTAGTYYPPQQSSTMSGSHGSARLLEGLADNNELERQPTRDLAAPQTTKYLAFQLMTADPAIRGQSDTPHIGGKMLMDTFADQLVTGIGERGDHVNTQLGIVVGPLSWDMSDDQIRGVIRNAFAVAEERNIAVGFHIDDSMFWNKRQDLWSNRNNVEWSDWNATVVPHRVIGFVSDLTELAPPMCYNSPAVIAATTHRARDVMGTEIKKGLNQLASRGKSYLFAGVIVGWETRMQDDSYPPVYYGYCALHNLGYSASQPPKDMDKALEGVVADWIRLWARNLEQAGIPRWKIFMHIAYPGELGVVNAVHLRLLYGLNTDVQRDFYKGANPSIIGLDTDANPGFSVYGVDTFPSLHRILEHYGNPPWAISEGTNIDLSNAFSNLSANSTYTEQTRPKPAADYAPSASMEQYLSGAFNHGAVLVNLFGWDKTHEDSAFATATMGTPALDAYRKFLTSEPLLAPAINPTPRISGSASTSSIPRASVQQLADKMERIQRALPAWLKAHGDRKPELESLFQQLDGDVKAHDMAQAQETADKILRLIQAN